mmetsp:Transcript_34685/g.80966  ORF Transcript_34685/g.80966 Transcript_34685/m.80966 type:complete len:321 (+) Transcript_34685:49-1011(+)
MPASLAKLVTDATRIRIPIERLECSPSSEDGIDAATEEKLRHYGATLIQKAGVLLRMPQLFIASAAVFFHRLYFEKSFAEVEVKAAAGAALFLAGKVEERVRKLSDVVLALYRVEVREDSPEFAGGPAPKIDKESKDYSKLKRRVSDAENLILQVHAYNCDGVTEHAHKYFLEYCRQIGKSPAMSALAQHAWGHLNDTLISPICCIYHPSDLAAMGLLLASRDLKMKLPSRPPWWEVFDADRKQVLLLASELIKMHRRAGPPTYVQISKGSKAPGASAPVSSPGPMASPSDDEAPPANADSDTAAEEEDGAPPAKARRLE